MVPASSSEYGSGESACHPPSVLVPRGWSGASTLVESSSCKTLLCKDLWGASGSSHTASSYLERRGMCTLSALRSEVLPQDSHHWAVVPRCMLRQQQAIWASMSLYVCSYLIQTSHYDINPFFLLGYGGVLSIGYWVPPFSHWPLCLWGAEGKLASKLRMEKLQGSTQDLSLPVVTLVTFSCKTMQLLPAGLWHIS